MSRLQQRRVPASKPGIFLAMLLQILMVSAQIVDYSKMPACAQNCNNIIAAQNLCVPPVTTAANTVCFCNSNYLVSLANGQLTGTCDNICTAQEMQSVLSYYKGLCNNAAAPAAPAAVTTTRGSGGAVVTVTVPATTATASSAAGSAQSSSSRSKHKSWISTHYGWIIMVIVLVLAAIAAIIFGVWFKRRHRRKHDIKNRDSTLGTADAIQALRDPHPVPASSMTSRQDLRPATAPIMREQYNSAGSLQSARSNPRMTPMRSGSLGAGVRAPDSSASDLRGKGRIEENEIQSMRQPPIRKTSNKLQRRPSGAGTPNPPLSPTSPVSRVSSPGNAPKP